MKSTHTFIAKMKTYQTIAGTFLRNHWFKLSIFLIILTAFAGKNMQVNFHIKKPAQENIPQQEGEPKAVQPLLHTPEKPVKKIEKVTDADHFIAQENTVSKTGLLSVFGGNEEAKLAPDAEIIFASEEAVKAYIQRFAKVAVTEMDKFNIPASVTLGQSLIASQAGTSIIAKQTNNYFNLECKTAWEKETATYDGACMRSYETAWFSFRNHSKYISEGDYKSLTHLDKTDYKRWAKGLQLAQYSKDNLYAEKLIRVIEQYELHTFDTKHVAAL